MIFLGLDLQLTRIQCADLTLSNNFTITETCTNATSSGSDNDSDAAVSLHLMSATTFGLLSAVMSLFVGLGITV